MTNCMLCGETLNKQFEYEYCGTKAGERVEGSLLVAAPDWRSAEAMAAQRLRDMGIATLVASFEPDLSEGNGAMKCLRCNVQHSTVDAEVATATPGADA